MAFVSWHADGVSWLGLPGAYEQVPASYRRPPHVGVMTFDRRWVDKKKRRNFLSTNCLWYRYRQNSHTMAYSERTQTLMSKVQVAQPGTGQTRKFTDAAEGMAE